MYSKHNDIGVLAFLARDKFVAVNKYMTLFEGDKIGEGNEK